MSSLASGRFSVRLIFDGAVSFAFIPVLEVAALAVVYWRATRRDVRPPLSFTRAVDVFLHGNTPWLIWLAAVATLGAFIAPRQAGWWFWPVLTSAVIPVAWSVRIDLQFFRQTLQRSRRSAVLDIVMNRAVSWTLAIAYFLGIAIWAEFSPGVLHWMGL